MALESLPKISPANFSPDNDLIQVYSKKGDYVGVINPSYIKSSPSGVSGAIQFSDGSAFASSSNLTWNNATNALGLGSGTTSAFIDFASNPAGSTTTVGAIRTYVDGVNLSEVMTFREDGFVGLGTTAPIAPLNVYNSSASVSSIVLVEQDTAAIVGQINQYRKNGSVNLVSGAEIGRLSFGGYFNSTYSPPSQVCSAIYGYYGGTGTDRVGGLRLITWNGGGASTRLQVAPDGKIGIGTTAASAKLQIVGDGSTSATTSLLVQNSSGTTSLQVTDDRTTFVNGLLNVGTIYSGIECTNIYSAIFQNAGTAGQIRLSMGGTNYLQIYQPKDASSGITAGTINTITTPISYGYSSGTASPNLLSLNPSINNTGTYSGTFRGIYYNPTLTSLTGTTHYGIQTTSGGAYINTTTPQASACLQADSTTQGFLPPRMTDAQIRAIASPTNGLVAYNTDISHLCCYQAGAWVKFSHSPM